MRIGIDYLPASTHAPGVGRYARELVAALLRPELPPTELELALWEAGRARPHVPPLDLQLPPGGPWRRRRLAWPRRLLRAAIPLGLGPVGRWGDLDLFHQVRPWAPLPIERGLPWTACVSELPGRLDGAALAGAEAVLVFSHHTRRRLEREAGVPGSRLHVVRVGCDHWSRRRPTLDPVARTAGPTAEPPCLLALGAPRPERQHPALLAAAARLVEGGRDLRLVLMGRGLEALAAGADARRLGDRLRCLDPDERALPELVARTSVLVHLAAEEQTAVTLLEACAEGAAVVASRLPAFEETLGELACWVDDEGGAVDPLRLADVLDEALRSAADPNAAQRRRALAARHRWEDCAADTLAVWRSVVAR